MQETKEAAGDDTFPDGTRIKRGEFVSYSSYAMGRLKCIWGPDVMEFKPERWLKNGIFLPQSPFKLTAFQVRRTWAYMHHSIWKFDLLFCWLVTNYTSNFTPSHLSCL